MIIGGLTFRIYPLSKNLPLVEGFHILLSDRDSENIFHKDRFNLDGVELKTSIKEPGYKLYDLKIYKEIYLEDHDNFRCINYANFGDYNSVSSHLSAYFGSDRVSKSGNLCPSIPYKVHFLGFKLPFT